MRVALFVVAFSLVCLVGAGLAWLIWENRGSEKLLGGAVTGALALFAGVFAVFFFTPPSSFSETFGTTLLMETATQLPVSPDPMRMPAFSPSTTWVTSGAKASDSRWKPDGAGGMRLYHHVLQRAVLNWLMHHFNLDWRIGVTRVETGTVITEQWAARPEDAPEGTTIGEAELKSAFAGTPFIEMPSPSLTFQVVVPPDMRMTVVVPGGTVPNPELGLLAFENRYYKFAITTQVISAGSFIGRYAVLFGLSPTDRTLSAVNFAVTITGRAKRPFQMHPNVPKFEAWGKQIARGLRQEFDETQRWRATLEAATFNHLLPPIPEGARK